MAALHTTPAPIVYSMRPSQVELYDQIFAEHASPGVNSVAAIASTGSGKTVVMGHIIAEIIRRLYPTFRPSDTKLGWKCPQHNPVTAPPQIFFVVHRDSLVRQTVTAFKNIFISRFLHDGKIIERGMDQAITTIKSGDKYNFFSPIVIVSQQSLRRTKFRKMLRLGQINPRRVFFDEFHTTVSNPTGMELVEDISDLDCPYTGFSATPFWADKEKVISKFFHRVVCGKSFGSLIRSGELCPLVYLEPDYPKQEIEEYIDAFTKQIMTREIECGYQSDAELDYAIDKWIAIGGPDLKTIAFVKDVAHGEKYVEALRKRGFRADIVSYKQTDTEKEDAFNRFEKGDGQVLVSVDSLGVGYDFNKIQCVQLLAIVNSLVRHWQQMGRGARLCNEPGFVKNSCYVLDYVKNIRRHGEFGIPDNIELSAEMLMSKKARTKGKSVAPTKVCPKCDFINYASSRKCQKFDFVNGEKVYTCKHEFPVKQLAEALQVIPGDMHRIFLPGMEMNDQDRIEMMRSLRSKRYARNHNPNAGIGDYNDNSLSEGLKMPTLSSLDELKTFTVGAIRGKPNCPDDAEKWLKELIKRRKASPNKWTTQLIFTLIFLEYDDEVAADANWTLIHNKTPSAEQLALMV